MERAPNLLRDGKKVKSCIFVVNMTTGMVIRPDEYDQRQGRMKFGFDVKDDVLQFNRELRRRIEAEFPEEREAAAAAAPAAGAAARHDDAAGAAAAALPPRPPRPTQLADPQAPGGGDSAADALGGAGADDSTTATPFRGASSGIEGSGAGGSTLTASAGRGKRKRRLSFSSRLPSNDEVLPTNSPAVGQPTPAQDEEDGYNAGGGRRRRGDLAPTDLAPRLIESLGSVADVDGSVVGVGSSFSRIGAGAASQSDNGMAAAPSPGTRGLSSTEFDTDVILEHVRNWGSVAAAGRPPPRKKGDGLAILSAGRPPLPPSLH